MSAAVPDLAAVQRSLRVDAAAVRAIADLRAGGIDPILLKGRGLARELYDTAGERTYHDCDLLVPAARHPEAEALLARAGYRPLRPDFEDALPPHMRHARDWAIPGHRVSLELHWTVIGARVEPARVWGLLAPHAVPTRVGPAEVRALAGPAAAWHVAVHAAQHGPEGHPLEDLRRAVARYGEDVWGRAATLARELDSTPAFAFGLRMVPDGRALAARLGLPVAEASVSVQLLGAGAPGGALGIAALAEAPGLRERTRLVARTLVPAPETMRVMKPLARRPRGGLAAAYALRPLDLLGRLGPALLAWRRARLRADRALD